MYRQKVNFLSLRGNPESNILDTEHSEIPHEHKCGHVMALDNGNYSIYTLGGWLDCSILEITPDQEVIWKAEASDPTSYFYRTYKIPSIHPQAFSVIVDHFTINNHDNIIQVTDNEIYFTVYNKSGFTQDYNYMFSDLMDGGTSMFLYQEGDFILAPEETGKSSQLVGMLVVGALVVFTDDDVSVDAGWLEALFVNPYREKTHERSRVGIRACGNFVCSALCGRMAQAAERLSVSFSSSLDLRRAPAHPI